MLNTKMSLGKACATAIVAMSASSVSEVSGCFSLFYSATVLSSFIHDIG